MFNPDRFSFTIEALRFIVKRGRIKGANEAQLERMLQLAGDKLSQDIRFIVWDYQRESNRDITLLRICKDESGEYGHVDTQTLSPEMLARLPENIFWLTRKPRLMLPAPA
jgi:hypothetical protein